METGTAKDREELASRSACPSPLEQPRAKPPALRLRDPPQGGHKTLRSGPDTTGQHQPPPERRNHWWSHLEGTRRSRIRIRKIRTRNNRVTDQQRHGRGLCLQEEVLKATRKQDGNTLLHSHLLIDNWKTFLLLQRGIIVCQLHHALCSLHATSYNLYPSACPSIAYKR